MDAFIPDIREGDFPSLRTPDIYYDLEVSEDEITEIEALVSTDSSDLLTSIDYSLKAIESILLIIVVIALIFITSRVLSIFFKNI